MLVRALDSDVMNKIGIIYANKNNKVDALVCFKEALLYTPEDVYYVSNVGAALFENNEVEESISVYESIFENGKNKTRDYFRGFANSLIFNGQYDRASAVLEEAVKNFKHESWVYHLKGVISMKNNNYHDGIKMFDLALIDNKESIESILCKSDCFKEIGQPFSALESLSNIIEKYRIKNVSKEIAIQAANRASKIFKELDMPDEYNKTNSFLLSLKDSSDEKCREI